MNKWWKFSMREIMLVTLFFAIGSGLVNWALEERKRVGELVAQRTMSLEKQLMTRYEEMAKLKRDNQQLAENLNRELRKSEQRERALTDEVKRLKEMLDKKDE